MISTMTSAFMQAVRRARNEAIRLNHAMIGSDHLLLGLIGTDESTAIRLLRASGCDLDALQSRVEDLALDHHAAWDGTEFVPPFDAASPGDRHIAQGTAPSGIMTGDARNPSARTIPLTDTAENAMKEAMNQAKRYGRPATDTEHLLFAIIDQSDSVAASALHEYGVSREGIERLVDELYRTE